MRTLNRKAVRRHFSRAAAAYDEAAVLQRTVAERLDERLELFTLKPARILDVGAGTGLLTEHLLRRYPQAQVVAVDLSEAMLRWAQGKLRRLGGVWQRLRGRCPAELVVADAYQLPFADGSFDLVVSNLMLQWCDDLDAVLCELRRMLRPEGLVLFTSFGPDTLRELRQAWAAVDDREHVNTFIDMHDVGDALIRAGFGQPVMDVERYTLTYAEPMGVLKDLKAIGATYSAADGRGLIGKGRLQAMLKAYEAFRDADGRVPATYEVVHGHAWAAPEVFRGPDRPRDGVHEMTLDDFVRQVRGGS
ncbi:malonyl-ACP O-methyltransferase BioC [Sulfurivirga sp.]|uniref:malonyl-ACP O-methyltransferase BioC n=1 Tax=Sulfurivirga sp. TaxID=2614236 RepID=UPI0025F5DFA7|nr:malonyl-ACP O-methyltransferase BioC [Sulfurivirga sp.]